MIDTYDFSNLIWAYAPEILDEKVQKNTDRTWPFDQYQDLCQLNQNAYNE
jgi:hypothetical protein